LSLDNDNLVAKDYSEQLVAPLVAGQTNASLALMLSDVPLASTKGAAVDSALKSTTVTDPFGLFTWASIDAIDQITGGHGPTGRFSNVAELFVVTQIIQLTPLQVAAATEHHSATIASCFTAQAGDDGLASGCLND